MSTSDGNSTTRPLRRRKSKRFDRSGGSPLVAGSTVIAADDEDDGVEVDLQEETEETSDHDPVAVEAPPELEEPQEAESATADDGSEPTAQTSAATESTPPAAPADDAQVVRTEPDGRSRTLDQMTPCGRCGHDVSTVHIEVDGNILIMESCDNCDTRRWQLAGEAIELQQALDHVGEHTGRRR